MARKKKEEKGFMISAVIYGIYNSETNELVRISLDNDDIEMDMALQYVESKYNKCEFSLSLFI